VSFSEEPGSGVGGAALGALRHDTIRPAPPGHLNGSTKFQSASPKECEGGSWFRLVSLFGCCVVIIRSTWAGSHHPGGDGMRKNALHDASLPHVLVFVFRVLEKHL
jgi:hypothetical protein